MSDRSSGDVQQLHIFATLAQTYVAIVKHGETLFAIAWLPWLLGVAALGLLAFDWLQLLPNPLPLWLAHVGQAPFLAMIAVGIMRFFMLGVGPRRLLHLDWRQPVVACSVILAVTGLITEGVDLAIKFDVRNLLMRATIRYHDPFALVVVAHYAAEILRWLLATGLFATAYVLIGRSVAASAGQRGLFASALRRHPLRTVAFIFLLYLSMIPLQLLFSSVLHLACWPLDDSASAEMSIGRLASLLIVVSLVGTRFSVLATVLPAVGLGMLFRASLTPRAGS